jgi:hypothetical protein
MSDPVDTPVRLYREPWDAGRLRGELLRSHPHEVVTVRVVIDGVEHEFPVTSCRRWVHADRPTVTTLTVDPEPLVVLTPAGDDQ